MRLEVPGREPLTLLPCTVDSDIIVQGVDFGFPEARGVTQVRPGADGEDDLTEHHGAKAITITAVLYPTTRATPATWRLLRSWLHPRLRPRLVWREVGAEECWTTLRFDQAAAPWGVDDSSGAFNVQVGWRAPDGVDYSTETFTAELDPADPVETGVAVPVVMPMRFVGSRSRGAQTIHVAGSAPAWPLVRLFGGCTSISVTHVGQGRTIRYGASLADGEFAEVDMLRRTVQLNAEVARDFNRRPSLTARRWFHLDPGDNEIRVDAGTPGPGCGALLTWHATQL
jgi:hypothetical protein